MLIREVELDAGDANVQLPKEVQERSAQSAGGRTSRDAWNILCLQKTYLKIASLMAKGAHSAVVLAGAVKVKYARKLRKLMVAIWILRSRCAELYYLVFRF